jgi:curved DNA-binding protein CbpA
LLVLEAAARQLKELESQLLASNPKLENHLALYLQVLRDGLLAAVQQACFHLATQVYPDRYGGLEPSSRQLLHRRLVQLVQRANGLLSLERVVGHAAQIARQHQRDRRSQRRRVLDSIAEFGAEQEEEPEQGPDKGPDKGPEGSVHLGMALPIASDFLTPRGERPQSAGPAESDGEGDGDSDGDRDGDGESDRHGGQDSMLAVLAEAFQDWHGKVPPSSPSPWDGEGLPTTPDQLLAWIGGFELALSRRLRNLSHALNGELLRLGISRTVVPLNLLDAALAGELELVEAPANLLRLPLPLGMEPDLGRIEAMAVLLRPADLELEFAKLRTCRTRIQQHVQEVRRMAQHYRRTQRRVQALEAEQLWLQDINPAPPAPSLPP